MSKNEEIENNFEVENSQDLQAELNPDGINTDEDTLSTEPATNDDETEDTTSPKVDEPEEKKVEDKPEVAEQKPKRKSRAQRRIERVTKENAELRKQLEGKADDISIDDYDTYEEYEQAQADAENNSSDEKAVEYDKDDLSDVIADGNDKYEDFQELTGDKNLPLTEEILADVLESEQATDIIYHLAQDKEKTLEIAQMTPRERKKALLRIEIELESKPNVVKKRKASNAPDPITPVSGNSSRPASIDDDDLSFAEHEKLLNSQKQSSGGWA